MKAKFVLIAALFVALSASAQRESIGLGAPGGPAMSQIRPPIPAEFFQGHVLRMVNGKIYNASSWIYFSSQVYQSENGTLILYNSARASKYEAVTNYPGAPLADQTVGIFAMPIGTYDMGGRPIALYDCGTPYTPPPPTPEQIKAAQVAARNASQQAKEKQFLVESNAVRWLQSQATNGDAGAQCSLGEHFLTGQGCQTNRTLAIYWLTQAANQGDIEASNKLAKLKE